MLTKQDYGTTACLIHYCNANFTIIRESSYGYRNTSSGKFDDGIVGDLCNGKGDLAGSSLLAVKDRVDVVDFIKGINSGYIRFIFRQPPLSYTSNIMETSFQSSVWLSMFVVSILFTLTLYLILNWETNHQQVFKLHIQ